MNIPMINHLAVFAGALSAFVVGGIWYSPLLFHKQWLQANEMTESDLQNGRIALRFGLAFLLSLIISYNLAFFLSDAQTTWAWGLAAGTLAGLGWSSMGLGIVALFERRPASYVFVNGGYLTLHFAINGLILGLWR